MNHERTTLFDRPAPSAIVVNPSVPAADTARLTRQAIAVYRRLIEGPVTTGELSNLAAQYNARIKELRDWLRPAGWTVDKIRSQTQANNTYAIRPFAGSKYQAMLMRKSDRKSYG